MDPVMARAARPSKVSRFSAGARPEWWFSARLALGTASALGLARFANGLLVPAMRAELHWSLAQAGALTTANGVGYLVGAVITAPLARRTGVTATFRLGMVLIVLALAASALTGGYPVQLLARAAAGLAGALVFIAGGVIASRIAAANGSAAPIMIYFAGAGAGIALSGAIIPSLLIHPGRWPLAWAGLAGLAALAAGACWTAARDRGVSTGDAETAPAPGTIGRLWRIGAAYLLFGAGYIAYITFLSAYLARQHAPVPQVAVTWIVLGLAAVAAPALWSRPVLAWPGGRALTAVLACVAAAAALALLGSSPVAVTGSAVLYGGTFLCVPAAVTALIRDAVPRAAWTRVLAIFTVIFAAGQTAGPYLAGALADRYGTAAALVWTAALCTAGAALAASVPGRR